MNQSIYWWIKPEIVITEIAMYILVAIFCKQRATGLGDSNFVRG